MSITTAKLPNNAVGQPDSHQIETRFGTGSLTFDIASGNPPAGMTLNSSGVLSGTPTTVGPYTFSVRVRDAAGAFAVRPISKQVGTCVSPPSGLVSWWPGDGNANDIRGPNHGTLRNGVTFAPGTVRQAFQLDGHREPADGPIQSVQIPQLNITTGRYSLEFWVLPMRSAPSQNLVSWHPGDPNNFGGLILNGDHLEYWQSGGVRVSALPADRVGLNAWSHVALTYDGSKAKLYVNGRFSMESPASFQSRMIVPLWFGTHNPPLTNNNFGGLLDEVSLYDRALSDAEVLGIYNAGGAGKCRR